MSNFTILRLLPGSALITKIINGIATSKEVVTSVNGTDADESGNVEIEAGGGLPILLMEDWNLNANGKIINFTNAAGINFICGTLDPAQYAKISFDQTSIHIQIGDNENNKSLDIDFTTNEIGIDVISGNNEASIEIKTTGDIEINANGNTTLNGNRIAVEL